MMMAITKIQTLIDKKWHLMTALFCFAVITHQVFWCPIHGDGAFYSWIIKEFAHHPSLSIVRPNGAFFVDHPHLFVYWSWPFVKLFGATETTIKFSNYAVGFITTFLLYKTTQSSMSNQSKAVQAGLLSCVLLMLSVGYEHQIRQPMLDPLAHMFVLLSVYCFIENKSATMVGLLYALSFMTKGTEMIPYAAAFLVTYWVYNQGLNKYKQITYFSGSLVISLLTWFFIDRYLNFNWFEGHFAFQFKKRFLNEHNFSNSFFDFSFVYKLLKNYQPWFSILVGISIYHFRKYKKLSPLQTFFWVYFVFLCLAFSIIKKDSLQHYTGIYIFGSLVLASGLIEIVEKMKHRNLIVKWSKRTYIVMFALSTIGYIAFISTTYNKNDMWSSIKQLKPFFENQPNKQIVLDPNDRWQEEIHWAARWNWSNPIYRKFIDTRDHLTLDQDIFLVSGNKTGDSVIVKESKVSETLLDQLKEQINEK